MSIENSTSGLVNFSGATVFGGSLTISTENGFVPAAGSSFEVMRFNSRAGEFSSINGLDFGTVVLDPVFNPTNLVMEARQPVGATAQSLLQATPDVVSNAGELDSFTVRHSRLIGDADEDGEVGFADFLILSASFGKYDAVWAEGDFDEDGHIDFADFLTLSANFGQERAEQAVLSADLVFALDD